MKDIHVSQFFTPCLSCIYSTNSSHLDLGLLSVSTLFSNTFSIIQQGRDVTWYQDVVIWQFNRSQKLPGDDPELAIAAGAFGVDLVLYYIRMITHISFMNRERPIRWGNNGADFLPTEYYSYNVQAMLVMFWYVQPPCGTSSFLFVFRGHLADPSPCFRAAELCQLTYQVGERRKIRILFRKLHAAGKFISWLLPLITILSLQIPALRRSFVPFILITDLPCQSTSHSPLQYFGRAQDMPVSFFLFFFFSLA